MAREFYQGFYQLKNPQKYVGKKLPYFRSSYELRLFNWMDENMNVVKWASENLSIPYIYDFDQKVHQYIPDVYCEIIDKGTGKVKKYLVEIKPKKQLSEPTKPKNKNGKAQLRYQSELREFVKNQNKWKAAQDLCVKQGWKFKIFTEDQLF